MSVVFYAILGGILRRGFGGGLPTPRIVELVAMAVLAGWLAYLSGGLVLGVIMAILTVPFWTMGHGSYMDMGMSPKPDNERFKPIVDWLVGKDDQTSTKRDFVGMTVRYTIPAMPMAIAYAYFGILSDLWLLLVGTAIACAYWCFMHLRKRLPLFPPFLDGFTAYGEAAAGAIFYGILAAISS